jgi:hypothetical protein
MSVKSQLHACSDALMVAVRAAQRAAMSQAPSLKILRACQDLIEQLEQSATEVSVVEIEMALNVVTQALVELGRQQPAPTPAMLGAVRNAVDRLKRLSAEFSARRR